MILGRKLGILYIIRSPIGMARIASKPRSLNLIGMARENHPSRLCPILSCIIGVSPINS